MAVIWAIYKEGNLQSFEGRLSHQEMVVANFKCYATLCASQLPSFHDLTIAMIVRCWNEVVFS